MTQPNPNKPGFPSNPPTAPTPAPVEGMLCAACIVNGQESEGRTMVEGTLLCPLHARMSFRVATVGRPIEREQRGPRRADQ